MDRCPNCGCSSEEPLVIEKRFLFWMIKITDPLGLKKFNQWNVIPLSISKEGMKKILKMLSAEAIVPDYMIKPVYIPDIADAYLCFNCGFKRIVIGK